MATAISARACMSLSDKGNFLVKLTLRQR